MADEFGAVADVVCLIVFGVSKDGEDAIGRKFVHFVPDHRRYVEGTGRGSKRHPVGMLTVEHEDTHAAGQTDTKLPETTMGMESAGDVRLGAMNPVDATDRKRQRLRLLDDGQAPPVVGQVLDGPQVNQGSAIHGAW